MSTSYNRIAGKSVERLAAISDGIFGVAMTLLLLGLAVPDPNVYKTESALLHQLVSMLPDVLVYLMSFLTLGIFWVRQQTQLNNVERSDWHFTWINLAFLFLVTILPFTTRLLVSFMSMRAALLVYWGNIVLLGSLLYGSWIYAGRAKLLKDHLPADIQKVVWLQIVSAQGLYLVAALLCVFNTKWSIAFIVIVQLYHALAPRAWWSK
jgi:uncharacterized membrane protein